MHSTFAALLLTAVDPGQLLAQPETVAQQINRRIDEEMLHPRMMRGESGAGMVHVAFALDNNGMPYDICVAKRAFSGSLNRAAVATVRRIGPIRNARPSQRFVAVLQYDVGWADDDVFKRALKTEVMRAEQSSGRPRRCRP